MEEKTKTSSVGHVGVNNAILKVCMLWTKARREPGINKIKNFRVYPTAWGIVFFFCRKERRAGGMCGVFRLKLLIVTRSKTELNKSKGLVQCDFI